VSVLARHELRHADGRRLFIYGELRGDLDGEIAPDAPPPQLHQRFDPLLAQRTAIAPARNTRPYAPVREDEDVDSDVPCPLCPGGPEIPFPYELAAFENRWPTFMEHPPPPPQHPHALPARGRCEVLLYTSSHVGSLRTLAPAELARLVAMWTDRSTELWADSAYRFVMVFENRGAEVGATLSHPHGQLYAFDHLPPIIERRVDALATYRRDRRACLTCETLAEDAAEPQRRILEDEHFSVSVPYAARWPYEVHVRAWRHGLRRLGDLSGPEAVALSRCARELVRRYDVLFGFDLPYMMTIMEAPEGADDWHLALEFMPVHRSAVKLKIRASVETATGLFINDVEPERSAGELAGLIPDPEPEYEYLPVPEVVAVSGRAESGIGSR
jgi:UDPglucose--hexose-1-phosphate uridylyltransferase